MKQKLAATALLLSGFAFVQTQMPAIDPSGIVYFRQLEPQNNAPQKSPGFLADPGGTATIKANAPLVKP